MAQHTPGPWSAQGIGLHYEITARAPLGAKYVGVRIARAFSENPAMGFADSPSKTETEANACLIAAAPDLLAALRCARMYLGEDDTDDSEEAKETRRVIDAAIAKARGEG